MEVLQDYLYKLHIELILWRSLWGVTPPSVICIPTADEKVPEIDNQQFHTRNNAQQFRNGDDQSGLYRSEDRGTQYHQTSQSFNVQRHIYAEQAMNVQERMTDPIESAESITPVNSASYNYQATVYFPKDDLEEKKEFRRYVSETYETSSLINTTSNDLRMDGIHLIV